MGRNLRIIKLFVLVAAPAIISLLPERQRVFANSGQKPKYEIKLPPAIPADLWEMLIPADNPMTEAKVALGRDLYFDKRLSFDNTVSCATCHDPKTAFAEPKQFAEGIGGKRGARN